MLKMFKTWKFQQCQVQASLALLEDLGILRDVY